MSGDDTKLGTDHTKADVYESSNDMSVGSSISENQIQSDSDLEDDLFILAEDNEIWQMKVLKRFWMHPLKVLPAPLYHLRKNIV